jgi:hypothetical protein
MSHLEAQAGLLAWSEVLPAAAAPLLALLVGAALVGYGFRRRWPAGVAEGLVVGAVSGAAIALAAMRPVSDGRPSYAWVLTPLAVGWYLVWGACVFFARRSEPRRPSAAADLHEPASGATPGSYAAPAARGGAPRADSSRPLPASAEPFETAGSMAALPLRDTGSAVIFRSAALLCAVAAVALWLATGVSSPEGRRAALIDLGVLLAVASIGALWQVGRAEVWTLLVLLWSLVALGTPAAARLQAHRGVLEALAPLLAATSLFVLLLAVWWVWRRRRAAWLRRPERLLRLRGSSLFVHVLLMTLVLAVAALAAATLRWGELSPRSLLMAAIACLGTAHRRQSGFAAEAGLLMLFAAFLTGVAAIGSSILGMVTTCVILGGLALWLSRFWTQQLLDGRAWTTTGRLVAPAEALAVALTLGAGAAALVLAHSGPGMRIAGNPGLILLLAVCLLYVLLLTADRGAKDTTDLAACVVVAIAAAAAQPLLESLLGLSLSAALLLAGAASLLALRSTWRPPGPLRAGFLAGVVPALVLITLIFRGPDRQTLVACLLGAGGAAATCVRVRRPEASLRAAELQPPA